MEAIVTTDPAIVVEVEQDRAREAAYRAGYDDAIAEPASFVVDLDVRVGRKYQGRHCRTKVSA